jgi:hypothetical protein
MMVIVAEAESARSATDVAVTTTCVGTLSGAVYNPSGVMVPQPEPAHPVPLTLQLTAVLVVPVTVAENCRVCPSVNCAVIGEIVTPICCVISRLAVPDLVVSATEVAVTVTKLGLGASDGAVYRPVEVILPQIVPAQPVPLMLQVTEVLLVPVTVAVNCCFPPTPTDGFAGETLTAMLFGATIVTTVEPEIAPLKSDVAVTNTVFGAGAAAGAVYRPVELIDPQVMPEQPPPETLHTTTPLCEPVALNWTWAPGFTCGAAGEIDNVGVATIVTVAVADSLGSATDVARRVTVAGEGTLDGAVYNPVVVIVPQVAPLHPDPERVQVTAVFVVPATVAENCCCPPVETCAVAGATVTETAADDWITMEAEADFVESATDVAVTVARAGLGMVAGAVYNPPAVMEPQEPATQPIPETAHVTPVFELPVTVAVNCC